MIVRRILPVVLICALATCAGAQLNPYTPRYVVMDPPIVYPGAVVRLMTLAPEDAHGGWVRIGGREFPGYIDDGFFYVYFAVDLGTTPGPHKLEYEVGGRRGQRTVTVRQRSYEEESLEVEPSYVHLSEATLARVTREKERLDEIWTTVTEERMWGGPFAKPAAGELGSPFGLRRVFNGEPRSRHSGLDVRGEAGDEVLAANGGRVALIEDQFFTGNLIVIDHGLGLYSYYAHLSAVFVDVGDRVVSGELIGAIGSTGRATGPHLHWGAKLMGARVDPVTLPGFSGAEPELSGEIVLQKLELPSQSTGEEGEAAPETETEPEAAQVAGPSPESAP